MSLELGFKSLIAFAFVDVLFLPIPYLMYKQHVYFITNKRIIIKKDIFRSSIISIPLTNIKFVTISNSFLERICGIRSIYFEEPEKSITKILFSEKFRIADFPILYAVPRAEEVRNLILNLKYKS
ncbi:MAG: PH domain-containing protein [Candidatus Aenigmatarchaeota archaeon]